MQSKIDHPTDIIFEWIPYNRFDDFKEICKGCFATVYSAVWKDGPLNYINKNWIRDSDKKVVLKCLNKSQNGINRFLEEVRDFFHQKLNILLIIGLTFLYLTG
jgi:serine/threonine protein kinase